MRAVMKKNNGAYLQADTFFCNDLPVDRDVFQDEHSTVSGQISP